MEAANFAHCGAAAEAKRVMDVGGKGGFIMMRAAKSEMRFGSEVLALV